MKLLRIIFAMSILLGVFIASIVFIPLVNAQDGQVTLSPTDDTYTESYYTDSNYGGHPSLIVSRYEHVVATYEGIVWLKFSLSDVPDGVVVDVATLELHNVLQSETYNVYAHQSSDISWTELTLTYSNMPSFNATPMDLAVVATSFEWHSWNVVDAVRNAVDGIHGGPDVVTIVLLETSLRSAFSSADFYSKDQVINVPKLTVHWSEIIPEFPAIVILPLFIVTTLLATFAYRKKRSVRALYV